MTPAEEARFIALWNAGTVQAAIAQTLGIPRGTVASRAYVLVRQGKIQPRPKGGAFPHQQEQGRLEKSPAPHPRSTRETHPRATRTPPAEAALPTREAPAITMVAVPELRELLHRFSALEARVVSLEGGTRTPPAPAHAPAAHPRVDIKQWTVRLSQALIEAVKAEATTEGKEPSHLVEELLWNALSDRRSSTP
jgi:hypothetical protein